MVGAVGSDQATLTGGWVAFQIHKSNIAFIISVQPIFLPFLRLRSSDFIVLVSFCRDLLSGQFKLQPLGEHSHHLDRSVDRGGPTASVKVESYGVEPEISPRKVFVSACLRRFADMMLHRGSIEALRTDLGLPDSVKKGKANVGPEFLQTHPLVGFSNTGFKSLKLEKHVVRSQSGSDPKPRVMNKSINFPEDYNQLVEQARIAAQTALKDGKTLLEVEFPTAGLDTVPGDEEGGIEMNTSIVLMKEFCTIFKKEAPTTRIFFPDAKDMASAKTSIFNGTSFKLDYLTKPNGLEDFGFGRKVKMADRVQTTDKVFVVAYPYFNVNEMIAVEELYKESAAASNRPIIIFNGELDRIRSGYYPAFFYPKLGSIAKEFLPKFETVYYIHNFKGRSGGVLFRMYPEPWQVLQRVKDGKYVLLHEQVSMPSLKEVALNILPTA